MRGQRVVVEGETFTINFETTSAFGGEPGVLYYEFAERPGELFAASRVVTDEGMRRYVETNGTYEGEPCTCTEACPAPCKGECGCEACHSAYQDFLSLE